MIINPADSHIRYIHVTTTAIELLMKSFYSASCRYLSRLLSIRLECCLALAWRSTTRPIVGDSVDSAVGGVTVLCPRQAPQQESLWRVCRCLCRASNNTDSEVVITRDNMCRVVRCVVVRHTHRLLHHISERGIAP